MSDAASPPTSLVALRDRREAAIQLLADSFAADLLTIDQFDERIARAHAATQLAELEALVADLAPLSPAPSTALVPLRVDTSLVPAKKRLRSLLGNLERGGPWVVPDQLAVSAILGNASLDFRDARFTAGVTEIDVRVFCGNLEIIVPPHLAVDCESSPVLGNIEIHGGTATVADPDRPLLRITGSIVLGNLEIQVRLPGETERDARRRRRRDRKALAAGPARPALPAGPAK